MYYESPITFPRIGYTREEVANDKTVLDHTGRFPSIPNVIPEYVRLLLAHHVSLSKDLLKNVADHKPVDFNVFLNQIDIPQFIEIATNTFGFIVKDMDIEEFKLLVRDKFTDILILLISNTEHVSYSNDELQALTSKIAGDKFTDEYVKSNIITKEKLEAMTDQEVYRYIVRYQLDALQLVYDNIDKDKKELDTIVNKSLAAKIANKYLSEEEREKVDTNEAEITRCDVDSYPSRIATFSASAWMSDLNYDKEAILTALKAWRLPEIRYDNVIVVDHNDERMSHEDMKKVFGLSFQKALSEILSPVISMADTLITFTQDEWIDYLKTMGFYFNDKEENSEE